MHLAGESGETFSLAFNADFAENELQTFFLQLRWQRIKRFEASLDNLNDKRFFLANFPFESNTRKNRIFDATLHVNITGCPKVNGQTLKNILSQSWFMLMQHACTGWPNVYGQFQCTIYILLGVSNCPLTLGHPVFDKPIYMILGESFGWK